MAFSYTTINTEPEDLGDNNFLYINASEVSGRGTLVQTYIQKPFNIQIPKGTNPETFRTEQVNPILSEQSFFVQGLTVSDLTSIKVSGSIPWTTVLTEILPRNQKRITRAATVTGKGSLIQVYMQTEYTENNKPKLTMAPEKLYWVCGVQVSGTDLVDLPGASCGGGGGASSFSWDYLDTTPPTGISGSNLIANWQFDNTVSDLNDRSGNGHTLQFDTGTKTICGIPISSSEGVKAAFGFYEAQRLSPVGSSSDFRILTDITVEITFVFEGNTGTQDFLIICDATGETPDTNVLWSLSVAEDDGRMRYIHESGSGVNHIHEFDSYVYPGLIQYACLTRNSVGTGIKYYQNGLLIDSITTSAPPSGGGSTTLYIGDNELLSASLNGAIMSVRIWDTEFSAAQVLEAYKRVRGIV